MCVVCACVLVYSACLFPAALLHSTMLMPIKSRTSPIRDFPVLPLCDLAVHTT